MNISRFSLVIIVAALMAKAASPVRCNEPADISADLLAADGRLAQQDWLVALEAFEGVLVRLESDSRLADEVSRDRRRCLYALANLCRRLNRREDAWHYSLRYREELKQLKGTAFQSHRQENARWMAQDAIAVGDLPRATVLIRELLAGSDEFGPLKALPKIECLVGLALIEDASQHADVAQQHWKSARELALATLQELKDLAAVDRWPVLRSLILCCDALQDPERSRLLLKAALESPANQKFAADRLTELLSATMLRRDLARAEAYARQALTVAARERQAEAWVMLARVLQASRRVAEARSAWNRAIVLFEDQLKASTDTQARRGLLKQLRGLYQQTQQVGEAIRASRELCESYESELGTEHPLSVESRMALGNVLALYGFYDQAHPVLTAAVVHTRQKAQQAPLRLANALNNLAAVERALGNFQEARRLFEEALSIRERLLAQDDPDLATSYNNLASAIAAAGDYREAERFYRRVLEQAERQGERTQSLRITTLLNLATLYRSQGQLTKAAALCEESLQLHEQAFGVKSVGSIAHYNAIAALYQAAGRYAEAYLAVQAALDVCQRHGLDRSSHAGTAHARLGAIGFTVQAIETAEAHSRLALEIAREQGQQLLEARSLNLLGMLANVQGEGQQAEKLVGQALSIQMEISAPPFDRYSSLCNLAYLQKQRGDDSQAIRNLRAALQMMEAPRIAVTGAEQQRSEYFGQFAPAIELLVRWQIEARELDAAFQAAELGRNRSFLDQLSMAGVDLRQTLSAADQKLLTEETRLRQQLSGLQQQMQFLGTDTASRGRRQQLSESLGKTRRDYEQVWIQIRNASPVYRRLLKPGDQPLSLDATRRNVLKAGELMLFYFLGDEASWLLVFDASDRPVELMPLKISEAAGRALTEAMRGESVAWLERSTRGTIGIIESEKGERVADRPPVTNLEAGPLTRSNAAALTAWYVSALRQRDFAGRGNIGQIMSEKGRLLASPMIALTDTLLPSSIRTLISERHPDTVILVPDGALHSLPFEALLVEKGDGHQSSDRFILDELPPIAYVPSATILRNIQQFAPVPPDVRQRVLSAGDPAYPAPAVSAPNAVAQNRDRAEFLGSTAPLPRLPGTEAECRRIAQVFAAGQVQLLLGDQATERNVVQSLNGRGIVHLAAHGLVDEQQGNLFGGIALTPSGDLSDIHDDGLLSYAEILELPLHDCELAVLSACQTNVGPERPLESATSLAQAFLSAGSRRAVASHWNVNDESTVELIGSFLEAVATKRTANDPVNYAALLSAARHRVRRDQRWNSPYYWAPFVLIGPAR